MFFHLEQPLFCVLTESAPDKHEAQFDYGALTAWIILGINVHAVTDGLSFSTIFDHVQFLIPRSMIVWRHSHHLHSL